MDGEIRREEIRDKWVGGKRYLFLPDFLNWNPISQCLQPITVFAISLCCGGYVPEEIATDELARSLRYMASDGVFSPVIIGIKRSCHRG